jgi:TetR/AcrR family transcriptional regulator, transcriptional repressor for nem operon
VIDAVAEATQGVPDGAERIMRGAEAYLDVCLDDQAVKALAVEARSDPALTASMSARHERFAAAAVPSFRAMGWRDAPTAAQLFAAMTAEVAIRELEAAKPLPAARRTLRRFLDVSATR